jgi:Tol biopolymer transport system component
MRPSPAPDVWDLTLVDVQTGEPREWLATPAVEAHPAVSPDRAWVAYESDATGAQQVYVRALAGGPQVIPISTSGGAEPQWSEDGDELFYRNGNAIVAVPVRTDPTFDITGPAEVLFDEPYDFINDHNWDVMPGDRFLMIRSGPNIGREVRIMTGWLERLAGS